MSQVPAFLRLLLPAAGLGMCGFAGPVPRELVRPAPDCRAALLAAVRLLQPAQPAHSTVHLRFTAHTYFYAPGQRVARVATVPSELYARGRQLYFETPQTLMWQDGTYTAVVLRGQQTLYLTRTPPVGANRPAQFAILQDSLLQRAQVTSCQWLREKGKSYQQVVLDLTSADKTRYGITTLGFKLDKQASVRELTIVHQPGNPVSKVVYDIENRSLTGSLAKLPKDALAQVVDRQHRPLPPYQYYRVVDHTTSTRLAR